MCRSHFSQRNTSDDLSWTAEARRPVRQRHRLHVSASPGRPVSFVELDRAQDLIRQEVGKP
jgi:hypothetical protein